MLQVPSGMGRSPLEKSRPPAADYDESAEFPWDNLETIKRLGLFGLTIDEQYGGSGGTFRQLALVVEELARGCASTSLIYIAHLSLTTQFIQQFGSEEQKKKFIPPMARFEKIGAFAITEPEAGSDAGTLRTRLTASNGQYTLNGHKTFITNAPQAEIFATANRGDDNAIRLSFIRIEPVGKALTMFLREGSNSVQVTGNITSLGTMNEADFFGVAGTSLSRYTLGQND